MCILNDTTDLVGVGKGLSARRWLPGGPAAGAGWPESPKFGAWGGNCGLEAAISLGVKLVDASQAKK